MATRKKKGQGREKWLWIVIGAGLVAAFILISMGA